MPLRHYKATATLEFEVARPETVKADIIAASPAKAAFVAIKGLYKAHPGRRPSSFVCCIEVGNYVDPTLTEKDDERPEPEEVATAHS